MNREELKDFLYRTILVSHDMFAGHADYRRVKDTIFRHTRIADRDYRHLQSIFHDLIKELHDEGCIKYIDRSEGGTTTAHPSIHPITPIEVAKQRMRDGI